MSKINACYDGDTLSKIDGRTKAAKLAKGLRCELQSHVGPNPSASQRLLIDQAVQLQLRLAMADAEGFVAADYLVTSRTFAAVLDRIGIKGISEDTSSPSPLVAA